MGTASAHGGSSADGRVGVVTLIAGALLVVGAIATAATEVAWIVVLVGFALTAYALPRLHASQAPADGWAGDWGPRLVVLGVVILIALTTVYIVWETVGEPTEPAVVGVLWMVGFFSFVIGCVLFAVGSLIAGHFPRPASTLVLVGLLGGIALDMSTGAFFDEEAAATEWGLYIGVPLFGLGLMWIGAAVWRDRRTAAASV